MTTEPHPAHAVQLRVSWLEGRMVFDHKQAATCPHDHPDAHALRQATHVDAVYERRTADGRDHAWRVIVSGGDVEHCKDTAVSTGRALGFLHNPFLNTARRMEKS